MICVCWNIGLNGYKRFFWCVNGVLKAMTGVRQGWEWSMIRWRRFRHDQPWSTLSSHTPDLENSWKTFRHDQHDQPYPLLIRPTLKIPMLVIRVHCTLCRTPCLPLMILSSDSISPLRISDPLTHCFSQLMECCESVCSDWSWSGWSRLLLWCQRHTKEGHICRFNKAIKQAKGSSFVLYQNNNKCLPQFLNEL